MVRGDRTWGAEVIAIFVTWLLGASLLTVLASIICCRILITIAPKDEPDGTRKTQSVAVPSSGGIAFGAVAFGWVVYQAFEQGFQALSTIPSHLALFLGALLVGASDDIFALPAKSKFAALSVLALGAVLFGVRVDGIFLPYFDSYVILASWLGILGSALWIFVTMNATNFMDGSNGLAMGTLAIMIAALSFALYGQASQGAFNTAQLVAAIFGVLTVAAILGFLFWNLQGKLYAGDAGSLFGGAVFASLGLFAAQDGNIWFPATLALPFLVDVFMTLLWRARKGHNLLTPHRNHAYQLFIRSGWGHIKTALLWWTLAIICVVAALWAVSDSKSTSAWVFLAMLCTGCALWLWQRRVYGPRAEA